MKTREDIFDGNLGICTGKTYYLPMKEDGKPYHARAFPVPKIHKLTLKTEIYRLVKLLVLRKVNRYQWVSPKFITTKKYGTVNFISGFREVVKIICRKPYPIPKIQ